MNEILKNQAADAIRDLPDADNRTIRNILESIVNCYNPLENGEEQFLVQELNFFIERCQ